jgi:uncharacterized repeat protein (TIGR03806 family)
MRRARLAAVILMVLAAYPPAVADESSPVGLQQRKQWNTSQVRGSPDPPPPYRVAVAFAELKFNEPLDMARVPGTDRLAVAERFGKIYTFVNRRDVAQPQLLLDVGKTVYGVAFHPNFANNGYFYVTYIADGDESKPDGTRVSRFQVRADAPFQADPASEQIVIAWRAGGHNGGCLQFGPDGLLYVATGDSSGIADELQTGQDLTNVSGAILRLDVDRASPGKGYAIPADNPFVNLPGACPEIWAYGLRQPWKMSFDRQTGDLWTANVGQDLWEQVFLIQRGGNYGWSVMEGSHPFRPERPRGPTPFVAPVAEHNHADFRSITGGYVYHGRRNPELQGAYIYGDYDTGKIWMLRFDRGSGRVTEHRELVDSTLRLVGFGEDAAGELYLVDHIQGRILELRPNMAVDNAADFPRRLSQTGLFADVADQVPAAGVIPYSVIAPQWSDGAGKQRFLAVPGSGKIEFDGITYPQPAPGAPHGWKFPNGTVVAETISLELEPGIPQSRRKLETRILHYERLTGTEEVGDQYWQGYTYLWNEEQTDAVLVEDPNGLDIVLQIRDAAEPSGARQQTWRVPSRADCTVCHNMAAKYVLGLNTLQTNRDHDYGGIVANQLRTLEHIGMFDKPLPAPPQELPRLVDYADPSQDLALRARSYLHANCSHCHRKWGGGNAEFRLLAGIDLEEMGIVNERPAHGAWFVSDAALVAPRDPHRSVLYYRMSKLGPGRMPRIGSAVADTQGLALIHDWITQLTVAPADVSEGTIAAASADANMLAALHAATSAEDRQRSLQHLLSTTSGALRLLDTLESGSLQAAIRDEAIAAATAEEALPHVRDLFERYLPEQQRVQRLGNVVSVDQILALPGDVERGRQLFLTAAAVQCRNCHKIGMTGTDVGPDLSAIGKKYDRAKLLENMLNPSREIDPKFVVYFVQTTAGQVFTGLLAEKNEQQIVLKDAKGKLLVLAADDVEQIVPQQQSMMPDLLLRDMTAQQVSDLTEFLYSLK